MHLCKFIGESIISVGDRVTATEVERLSIQTSE
jgi:hypothetical protein